MKLYRPGGCAHCGGYAANPIHIVAPVLPWWKKVLKLARPVWMWQKTPRGAMMFTPHPFKPDPRDRQIAARELMNDLRRRLHR